MATADSNPNSPLATQTQEPKASVQGLFNSTQRKIDDSSLYPSQMALPREVSPPRLSQEELAVVYAQQQQQNASSRARSPTPKISFPDTQSHRMQVRSQAPSEPIQERVTTVEKLVFVPVDKIVYRDVPVPVEKIVYNEVQVPVEVRVQHIVERVEIKEVPTDRIVSQEVPVMIDKVIVRDVPYPVERFVEKEVVKYVDKVVVNETPIYVDKIIQQEVPVPVDRIVERIVEINVDKVITNEVVKYVDRIVIQEVPIYVDRVVEVPQLVEIERIVEKIVEIPVDRIIEKIVEIPVDRIVEVYVDVVTERIVEKMVEVPVERVVIKEVPIEVIKEVYIDRLVEVPVERIVERIIEVEKPVIVERIVEVGVERVVTVEKIVEVPVERIVEKLVIKEVPVEVEVERIVEKIVEVPVERVVINEVVKYVDKIVFQDKIVEVEKIVFKEPEEPIIPHIVKEKVKTQRSAAPKVQRSAAPTQRSLEAEELNSDKALPWTSTPPVKHAPPLEAEELNWEELNWDKSLPLTLTLDMDFESISDGESFASDVASDVSAAANIDAKFVKVVGMRAGSVIVDIHIAPEAGNLDQIEQNLIEQAKSTDSALKRGKITSKARGIVKTVAQGMVKTVAQHMEHQAELLPQRVQLHSSWQTQAEQTQADIESVGLGLRLERSAESPDVYIQEIVAGFAAHASGRLQLYDVIVAVDNLPLMDMELEAVKMLTKGAAGSPCTLQVHRRDHYFQVTLIRKFPDEAYMSQHAAEQQQQYESSWARSSPQMRSGISHDSRDLHL